MRIELRDPRPPVSDEALAAAERKLAELGRTIPESYRELLADQDGGRPVLNCYEVKRGDRVMTSGVTAFLGVGPAPEGDLVQMAGLDMGLADGLLTIALDEVGNDLCIRDDGWIVFREHEDDELFEVARDLPTFLAALHEEPELPPQPPGRRRRFGKR